MTLHLQNTATDQLRAHTEMNKIKYYFIVQVGRFFHPQEHCVLQSVVPQSTYMQGTTMYRVISHQSIMYSYINSCTK